MRSRSLARSRSKIPVGRSASAPASAPKRRKRTNSMCGIVGIVGKENAAPLILEALKRLEYRGYDSAGIATLMDGQIERRRSPGKLSKLAEALRAEPLFGRTGIGHTRWATHGAPTEINAHPDRKSTRLNSSHIPLSRMPSSA